MANFSQQLDRWITIQRKTGARDATYGTETDTWEDVAARISANVQDVLPSKSEASREGIRVATQPTRIRIRYRPGITSDMRVIIHGSPNRTCQIVSGPAELGRHEGLEMMVEEYSS